MPYAISYEEQPDPADVRAVHQGLDAFNRVWGQLEDFVGHTRYFLRNDL
ncbi:MAG: hypothetical protein RLZZ387_980 [Chloroflexota bacterium]|jgi:hypothetical protein